MECYPLGIFFEIESVKSSLLCAKCHKVARNSVITSDNIVYGENCVPSKKKEGCRPMLAFRTVIENLEVHCWSSINCNWIGKLRNANEHRKSHTDPSSTPNIDQQNNIAKQNPSDLKPENKTETIENNNNNQRPTQIGADLQTPAPARTNCSYCLVAVSPDLYESHMGKCPNKVVSCPVGCGSQFQLSLLELHIENTCSELEVPCPLNSLGCGIKTKRSVIEEHVKTHFNQPFPGPNNEIIQQVPDNREERNPTIETSELESIKAQVAKQNQILEVIMTSVINITNNQNPIAEITNRLSVLESTMDEIRRETLKETKTGVQSSLQEFESRVFAQLARIQKQLNIPNETKAHSPVKPEFCIDSCPQSIRLLSQQYAVSQGTGTIAMMKAKVVPNFKYIFRIISIGDENFGIGFGDRSCIEQNNYEVFENDRGHGCYLITANSCYKKPGVEAWLKTDKVVSLFRENDVIALVFSRESKRIKLTNLSKENKSITIYNVSEDLSEYFPFVRLWSRNDSIEIVDEKKLNANFFDRDHCGASAEISSPTKCRGLGQGSICMLRHPIQPNFSFKFQAVGKQSIHFGVGVCIKKIVVANGLELSDYSNNGCYLFASDGYRRENLKDHLVKPVPGESVLFGNSETLVMRLDSQSRILSLMTFQSMMKSEIKIPDDVELSSLYPCIQLSNKGDQISLI